MQPRHNSKAASNPRRALPTRARRAVSLIGIALIAALLLWRLRPTAPPAGEPAVGEIVLGCAWLAWALVSYLTLSVAAAALAHLTSAIGPLGGALNRLAPHCLRRLVDTAITVGLAAAVLGASTATVLPRAAGATPAVSTTTPHSTASAGDLDWPGLADTVRRPRPDVGLVNGSRVLVQPGDSLWSIAARHLGSSADGPAITAAWHEWYAANRQVVGNNPNLIYPGQRLTAPGPRSASQQKGTSR
jgi:hypothetical protein